MAVDAFVSYSHADERALTTLKKHAAVLRREGDLRDWTDNEILPGDKLSATINANLAKSRLFLALLSPDYLNSKYCYDTEFKKAQEMEARGQMRIIPIIIEPCDWQSSPFGGYLALPKDGKAVSDWTNQNIAYLDIVKGLRRVVEGMKAPVPEAALGVAVPDNAEALMAAPARRPRIRQDFDAIQKAEFADEAYETIRAYFEASCMELTAAGDGVLKAKYEAMDSAAFTCTVVNRNRQRGSEAHITVRNVKGRGYFGNINYVFEKYAEANTSNGSVRVEADEYHMFLAMDRMLGQDRGNLTAAQVASELWVNFVKQAGIDYD